MPKIFISHSSKDNDFTAKLADALREHGAEVWIDLADIPAGMKWSKAIQQGLDWGELMLLIVTPDSMASENVADEWEYYHQKKKPIIPVWWKPAEMPFQLHRLQYVDFHQRDFDVALTKLGAELMRLGFAWPTPPPAISRIQEGELADSAFQTPRGTKHASSEEPQKDTRQFPIIIKPDWVGKIIPEPFEWCAIPSGQVTLEPKGYLKQAQNFNIPEFRISRYPITNEQFDVFVNSSDGWCDDGWWNFSKDARMWRAEYPKSVAADHLLCGECPRENVTWFSAVAFTRWLKAQVNENIELPTEQQWQRAAQGDDKRIFPWGNNWDNDFCSNKLADAHPETTTKVTRYLHGASPYGVIDMVGNVWEWCLTNWESGQVDLRGAVARVLRGGCWFYDSEQLGVSFRWWATPEYWDDNYGFRCAQSP
ncbi:MAG: SUMF1/EgtB/PvdO family nonheme iron enzyme [Chloroflexi bacterium]|uniref:SUMF1/EgtB/PvdO family nonheme iron enzyme n=1 Tax=Candidatus Flexifilum breve TaxID=3140694 RepID=UPI003134F445|nr:SUMF1/EgtB/PvdO family nonheme iron enzyme [Chloroflexota bacterium]